LRLILSLLSVVLGFLGVLWAVLATTGDGGGWGRGEWQDFVNTTGKEWKVWFGDRIARIAILMWLGAGLELIVSLFMWSMLEEVKEILGLGLSKGTKHVLINKDGKKKTD
jgi:hypothetical protein